MSVLVVAAHPDDEVLGCGGTIARLAAAGTPVRVAILGEGVTSRYERREEADPALLDELRRRSAAAAAELGVPTPELFGLPDNRFDTLPLLEVVKLVERLVDKHRPETIYTHHGADLNVDHAVVHRAVLTATRPLPGAAVRKLYAFEVASSTEWSFGSNGSVFRPNVFRDISRTLETKVRAMELYESERKEYPHPRSPEALRAAARRWGSVSGVEAAEAFELIRAIDP